MAAPASWPEPIVDELVERCEAHPERETCGFVVSRGGRLEVVEVENVAGRPDDGDPAMDGRSTRDAYVMDPVALLRIHRELRASGGAIVAVWHSHLDGSAAFSAVDRAAALAGGVEQLPGAEYLIIALRGATTVEVRGHRLSGAGHVERRIRG